jgi:RHS repeat-associated protein
VWRYLWYFDPQVEQFGTDCRLPKEYVAAVEDPNHTIAVTYYSVYRWGNTDNKPWNRAEYGLPMTKSVADPDPEGGTRYLSSEVYQCSAALADPHKLNEVVLHLKPNPTCGAPLRRTYVKYEYGSIECPSSAGDGLDCTYSNPRVASEATEYRDDPRSGTYPNGQSKYGRTMSYRSDFDGFGHYRRTVTGGNIFAATYDGGGDMAVAVQDYNNAITYTPGVDTVTGYPANWLVNLYTHTTLQTRPNGTPWDPGTTPPDLKTRKVEFDFDSATGFLRRKRTLSSSDGSQSSHDLLVTYERGVFPGVGRLQVREKYYGGDLQALNIGALASLGLPSDPEYQINTDVAWGGIEHRYYASCGGGVEATIEQNGVDYNTALVTASKDHSGATTEYEYDGMGRLTRVEPQGQEASTYTYYRRENGQEVNWARVVMQRSGVESEWRYDHRGRLSAVLEWLPGPKPGEQTNTPYQTYRRITYDRLGRKKLETTPGYAPSSFSGYTATTYDTFGRVLSKTLNWVDPTSATNQPVVESTTTYSYVGPWKVTESVQDQSPRVSFLDGQGRLIRVEEASGTQGGVKGTRYEYDFTGELSGMYESDSRSLSGAPRASFERDGRGLLMRENLAELKGTGEGYRYKNYDARGHFHRRELVQDGGIAPVLYAYDRAERMTEVATASKVLKKLRYYPDGDTAALGFRRGKLMSAERLNTTFDPTQADTRCDYRVTQTYEYDGSTTNPQNVQGKIRTVTLSGATATDGTMVPCAIGNFGASTHYQYDRLGNITSITYPNAGGGTFSLDHGYELGQLRTITDWVTGMTYHPSGSVARTTRSNLTRDVTVLDRTGVSRTNVIRVEKVDPSVTMWRHGPITYDGAANIKTIGPNESYTYDGIGRLKTATHAGPNQPGYAETYTYDRWGNLTAMNTAGRTRTLAVDAATNRLQSVSETGRPAAATFDYDNAGNVTRMSDIRNGVGGGNLRYDYDAFNMIVRSRSTTDAEGKKLGRINLYDHADERVAQFDYYGTTDKERWTIRGLGTNVLSEFVRGNNGIIRKSDYVYAGARVIGQLGPDGTMRHLHGDHLGTVRFVTDGSGNTKEQRRYLPFGEELSPSADLNSHKYTGHERDDDGIAEEQHADLDYMHARFYAPVAGRFLTLDPNRFWVTAGRALRDRLSKPQVWNSYGYAQNNPLNAIDPDGRETTILVRTYEWTHTYSDTEKPWRHVPGKAPGRQINQDVIASISTEAAVAISRDGKNFLFAPGTRELSSNASATDFADAGGGRTRSVTIATTPEQEAAIMARISSLTDGFVSWFTGGPAGSALATSSAIAGIGPFKDVGRTPSPANLFQQVEEVEKTQELENQRRKKEILDTRGLDLDTDWWR